MTGFVSAGPGSGVLVRTVGLAEAVAAASGGADETGLTSDEEGEIEDHLRGLGYVE